jgi:AraC-like DNA-binding protein
MVCGRCITAVRALLDQTGLQYELVQLGEVVLKEEPSPAQMEDLKEKLALLGFELLSDSKSRLIDKVKTMIIEQVHYGKGDTRFNLSETLSSALHKDYSYLSSLFSETEGITIEKYLINQKVEKVKELLLYDELPLSDIAFELGYSSTAHLSAQFKKVTGLTPTDFKKTKDNKRKTIDKI